MIFEPEQTRLRRRKYLADAVVWDELNPAGFARLSQHRNQPRDFSSRKWQGRPRAPGVAKTPPPAGATPDEFAPRGQST